MIYAFEVDVTEAHIGDIEVLHRGYVRLAGATIYHCNVVSPGGPGAHDEMCDDVMRRFAKQLSAAASAYG